MPVIELGGRRQIVSHAYGTSRVCACGCGETFTVTSITGRQKYASERCKDRVSHRRGMLRPEYVQKQRSRCAAWAARNRSVSQSNRWLAGAPPYGPHLPGGAVSIRVAPPPRWAVEHRNVRAVHGMLTEMSGVAHTPMTARWSMIPTALGLGWGAYFQEEDLALALACRRKCGVLFGRDVSVQFGPMMRIKAPRIEKRGHRTIRIDALTPVCVRSKGGSRTYTMPTAGNLLSTMATWLPDRLGTSVCNAELRLVERHTEARHVPIGGKYGTVSGWVGYVILDCNAPAYWLLKAAETLGLGGRTAFGFGRIKVTE